MDYKVGTFSPTPNSSKGRVAGDWVQSPMTNDLISHAYVINFHKNPKDGLRRGHRVVNQKAAMCVESAAPKLYKDTRS